MNDQFLFMAQRNVILSFHTSTREEQKKDQQKMEREKTRTLFAHMWVVWVEPEKELCFHNIFSLDDAVIREQRSLNQSAGARNMAK